MLSSVTSPVSVFKNKPQERVRDYRTTVLILEVINTKSLMIEIGENCLGMTHIPVSG